MKRHLYILGFLAVGLAACQSEIDDTLDAVDVNPVEVRTNFTAEFEDNAMTRTELVDGARVKWDAGDKIKVYSYMDINTGSHYAVDNWYSDFTTEKGGFDATFTGSVYKGNGYYAFFPASAIAGDPVLYGVGGVQKLSIPMTIPTVQKATPGSFEKSLNLAYASSKNPDGNFKFSNVCALIGFKLSGSAAKNLSKVRFTSMTDAALTGKTYVKVENGGVHNVEGENFVELEGSFNTSDSFYMIVAPAALNDGFILSFVDKEGKEFTKKGLNAAELKASHILDLGTIDVDGGDFVEGVSEQYFKSSKSKPVTIAVIPEGFTKDQLSDYHAKAKQMIDFIFSVDPYKQYKDYFNVYILDAASNESGADVIGGKQVDTYFDAGWEAEGYSQMEANGSIVYSFVSAHTPDILEGKSTITNTGIFMLINDERYAGINHCLSDGRGYAMIATIKGGAELTWAGNKGANITNHGNWMNIALHEGGGHMFGRLLDEYWDNYKYTSATIAQHSWEVPMGLNVVCNQSDAGWEDWIPFGGPGNREEGKFRYVGMYEGGNASYVQGIWRSEQVSCMDDNRPYFNAYSRYLIAKRIHDIAGETFTKDDFLAADAQYKAIQSGVDFAGAEGLITTSYDGLKATYNDADTRSNYVEKVTIYPPLPSPVMTKVEKPEIVVLK